MSVLLALCLYAGPALGLIDKPMPLKLILVSPGHILMAKVEKMDATADPPRLVLKVQESLKKGDKAPFEQIRLLIPAGNEQAKKANHQPQLLKRLAADLPLVIFARKTDEKGKAYQAFVYSNGTWFQMASSDPAEQPWEFECCEPYLRGTFKGPTDDLRKVILAYFNDKKDPPAFDKKVAEVGGFGPEVKTGGEKKEEKKEEKKSGAGVQRGAVFAVIPTVAIGGPLAILAMLFPSLFGSPREIMRRWLALLTVASVLSIVYLIEAIFPGWLNPVVLWLSMALLTLLGVVWAYRRYRALSQRETLEALLPKRGEAIIFYLISIAGLILVPYAYGEGSLFASPWKELLLVWVMVWAGTLGIRYVIWSVRRVPEFKPRLSLEGIMLAALTVACVGMAWGALPRAHAATTDPDPIVPTDSARDDVPPRKAQVAWTFKAENLGKLHSTPLIHGDRVFVSVSHEAGLFDNFGRIYCVDRKTGQKIWSFDDNKKMKQVFCSPCWADGKLYVGEGYHQHDNCRMFCLDAESGSVLWQFPTRSHTESSPCVVNGRVYFGAGDDGIYCVDAKTGKEIWHFEGRHVDVNPVVVDGKLYGGSGYGQTNVMFCLDAVNGNRLWETPSRLPVFGSPTVLGKQVFFGTGTGNLIESEKGNEAGALVCLQADTGALIWSFKDVGDAVHTHPVVDRRHVYFGSRDKHVYCVNRSDGSLRWKQAVGSPIAASPAAVTCASCGDSNSVYAMGVNGQLCCFNADDGTLFYRFDVVPPADGPKAQMVSSPRVTVTHDGKTDVRRIYFGAALDQGDLWDAVLYCLEDRYQWPVPAGQWAPTSR
jgi:outer membrane protein assembly factor BamB